jgi:hypothetical protein
MPLDPDRVLRRRAMASEILGSLLEFTAFEGARVPWEFLTTMEALASIIQEPACFLFNEKNGRYASVDEVREFEARLQVVHEVSQETRDIPLGSTDFAVRRCAHCESLTLSREAQVCLWCGDSFSYHGPD